MAKYTICSEFINYIANEKELNLFSNVIMVFAQDNAYKVCIDKNDQIFSLYENIAMKSEIIRLWLKCMTTKKDINFEKIDIYDQDIKESKELFLYVCKSTFGEKTLIVFSTQDYIKYEKFISQNQIILLDKDEAKENLKPQNISYKRCNITMDKNSPIVDGSQNKLNLKNN